MVFKPNDFIAQIKGGLARATLYSVQLSNPVNASGDFKLQFLCKAAQEPGFTLGELPAYYFGRKAPLAGDREYQPWVITLWKDEDNLVGDALTDWAEAINNPSSNLRGGGVSSDPNSYRTDAIVTTYKKTGEIAKQIRLKGCFPQDVSAVELSWESVNTAQEHQVTFLYDYHERVNAEQLGNPIGLQL